LADKRFGEKEFIVISLFIMALATAAIFFIDSRNILIWSGVLLITRIGAAMLEVLRDSYFYKRIDGRDVDVINFFRTAQSFGYIFAAIGSTIILLVLPMKFIFLFIVVMVISALIPAFCLVDNKCERELAMEKAK
jgi:MFS family permease